MHLNLKTIPTVARLAGIVHVVPTRTVVAFVAAVFAVRDATPPHVDQEGAAPALLVRTCPAVPTARFEITFAAEP